MPSGQKSYGTLENNSAFVYQDDYAIKAYSTINFINATTATATQNSCVAKSGYSCLVPNNVPITFKLETLIPDSPGVSPPAPTQDSPTCPAKTKDDFWFNKSLGCLTVGKVIIDNREITPAKAYKNYVFDANQMVITRSVSDPSENFVRTFERSICIKNIPQNDVEHSDASYTAASLASYMQDFGINYASVISPMLLNNDQSVVEKCDSKIHPLVIDYATRKIESINLAAFSSIKVYDIVEK